jgi:hypothetical protein
VKFLSYETNLKKEFETEIRDADANTSHLFIQTWVPDYIVRTLRDSAFSWAFFKWDKIIAVSLGIGSPIRCFGAFTENRLDGLLCLESSLQKIKIEYIASAPWNYHTIGKMRRIGSGLFYFTIEFSLNMKNRGEFYLNTLPDAETFYEGIGMKRTGEANPEGLKEYFMSEKEADRFKKHFNNYVIKS